MNRRTLIAAIANSAMVGRVAAQPAPGPRNLSPETEAFIEEMVARHQFDREALRATFAQVRVQQQVLGAMHSQSRPRPWFEYRPAFVNRPRIAGGVRFWQDNAAALERAQAQYGVPPELVVATIAAETLFGKMMGTHPVLDSLSTLAFDFPKRAEFFRGELEQFLLLARELSIDPTQPRGSFAGAMGIPQFMPTSYRKWAVDFDGDGRIDLFRSAPDAIGSVANYYRVFGWVTGGPVAVRVSAPAELAETQTKLGIRPHTTVGALTALGFVPASELDPSLPVMVFPLITKEGTEYWFGFDNFFVITRYNRAIHYAMAVFELAREIRAARPGSTAAP
ncbi:MAG: lytic murein transglycosylase B [Rhodocyclaceae bacterium]|nr:lytic murein transglycosylase B [Rhodocyclaceae bacterium]MCA3090806.1 lytic murein transglycosylase B [Rhodocyclaceae bacterium]MCA3095515.1 lytic murein transglycosylase B [Rhodocyclaceae bacterium]MCA3097522.1 lytic murein transglycosylase B [Rhodocyclaceae bacterium]MCA3103756.1 lytic murein transglycosylase B [Rhodocyclaceae bacterium]